jgi:hypothetical protein
MNGAQNNGANTMASKKVQVECVNCNGKGKLRHFSHYANGICFWCNGSGKLWIDADTTDESEQDILRRAAYADLEKNSAYILRNTDAGYGDFYSNDLVECALRCEMLRAEIINPAYIPHECVYIVHRATGEKVTRREVVEARAATK